MAARKAAAPCHAKQLSQPDASTAPAAFAEQKYSQPSAAGAAAAGMDSQSMNPVNAAFEHMCWKRVYLKKAASIERKALPGYLHRA